MVLFSFSFLFIVKIIIELENSDITVKRQTLEVIDDTAFAQDRMQLIGMSSRLTVVNFFCWLVVFVVFVVFVSLLIVLAYSDQ